MKRCLIPILVLVLLSSGLFAGCITDSDPAPATTVPATVPPVKTTAVPVPTTMPTTVPTIELIQRLPPEREVSMALTKDRPTSEIHLLYQGGAGDILVTRVILRVYAEDGTYREYVMNNGKKPIAGDEIIADGTRGGDRCEVFVISSGTRFKVRDEVVYAGMYY